MRIALAMAAIVCLAACDSEKRQIEKAAYGYCHATANYDIDAARPFCTEETSRTTLVKAKELMALVEPDVIEANMPAEIAITGVRQTSDTAAIATYHKSTPIKSYTDSIELRKRDGRWLAHSPLAQKRDARNKRRTMALQDKKEL